MGLERVYRRRRTVALAALAVLAVAAIAVLVARLSGDKGTPPLKGAARDVVATVNQFEAALAGRDWRGICDRLYSADARKAAGGDRCPVTLAQSAGGLRQPRVRIVSVVVRGQAATVTVAASVNGKPAVTDAIGLVREGGRFRISSAGVGQLIGVVLAGGAGRRIGGGKPAKQLAGRPLASYPAAALAAVCDRVAIVAKPGTELPRLPGVEVWDDEPAEPQHPLTGIVHALERAAGAPILVCAADMPFVTAEALRALIEPGRTAVATADGRLQPVLALYQPSALPSLRGAQPNIPLTRAVEALDPTLVPVPAELARNVNSPGELAAAERELSEA